MSLLYEKIASTYNRVSEALTFNQATLSGAIDVIVVQQNDRNLASTPFHVRFGKLQLLKSREKLVSLTVNEEKVDFVMKLGHAGEAYFVFDVDTQRPANEEELSSPLASPSVVPQPAALFSAQHGTITPIDPTTDAASACADVSVLSSAHVASAASTEMEMTTSEEGNKSFGLSTKSSSQQCASSPNPNSSSSVGLRSPSTPSMSTSPSQTQYSTLRSLSTPLRTPVPTHDEDDERAVQLDIEDADDKEELDETLFWARHVQKKRPFSSSPLSQSRYTTFSPSQRTSVFHQPVTIQTSSFPELIRPMSLDTTLAEEEPLASSLHGPVRVDSTPSSPLCQDDRIISAPSVGDEREHSYSWHWGHLPVHQQKYHHVHSQSEVPIYSKHPLPSMASHSSTTTSSKNSITDPSGLSLNHPHHQFSSEQSSPRNPYDQQLPNSFQMRDAIMQEIRREAHAALSADLAQEKASWTVRGIFSSVLSKIPGSSLLRPAPSTVSVWPEERKKDISHAEKAKLAEDSPNSSINLSETHLQMPWLQSSTSMPASYSPLTAPADTSSLVQVTPLEEREAPTTQHSAFMSPLSAPPLDNRMLFSHSDFALPPAAFMPNKTAVNEVSTSLFSAQTFATPRVVDSTSSSKLSSRHSNLPYPNKHSLPPPSIASSPVTPSSATGTILRQFSTSIQLSLCGELLGTDAEQNQRIFTKYLVSFAALSDQPELAFRSDLVVLYQSRLYPSRLVWPLLLSEMAFGQSLPLSPAALERLATVPLIPPVQSNSEPGSWLRWFRGKKPPPIVTDVAEAAKQTVPIGQSTSSTTSLKSTNSDHTAITIDSPSSAASPPICFRPVAPNYVKSLRPTSEMLASLNLKPGRNTVTFSVTSALQGEQKVSASIYLWTPETKIVISDIDGTITRSDVLGHVMPLIGRDWSHMGVTQLFSDIARNGYQILYLTSRAIGQANVTRGYIQSLKQGSALLPPGPILLSPDRLLHSLKREVIDRKPQEFKIIALKDIKALFQDSYAPFYAGFGNRITDVISYRAVGVPPSRIFIIDPASQVAHTNRHFSKNYTELVKLVSHMFPPLDTNRVETQYNDFGYWSQKASDLTISDDEQDENKQVKKENTIADDDSSDEESDSQHHVVPSVLKHSTYAELDISSDKDESDIDYAVRDKDPKQEAAKAAVAQGK